MAVRIAVRPTRPCNGTVSSPLPGRAVHPREHRSGMRALQRQQVQRCVQPKGLSPRTRRQRTCKRGPRRSPLLRRGDWVASNGWANVIKAGGGSMRNSHTPLSWNLILPLVILMV